MQIPQETLAWWATTGLTPATPDEVAQVQAAIGPKAPADYLAFLKRYGFATWDIDTPDTFTYRLGQRAGGALPLGSITHLWPSKHIVRMAADVRDGNPNTLPLFYPNSHFPIGGDAGQSQILVELDPIPGRIWFWPESEDLWGEGDNTELGFVADSFTDFIEGLKLEE